jgi:ElaB/YqjD/DUF883 family membrane-anchored ribosome-binding protein
MNGNGKSKNFSQALHELETHIDEIKDRVGSEAKKAKDTVEDQVQKNPWAAIGIIGLIFFILGFLMRGSRRGD